MSCITTLFVSSFSVLGLAACGLFCSADAAAPPAEAGASAVVAVRNLAYQEIAPGLLARTVFATTAAGPIAVEIIDILVGPGQNVQLPAGSAALLDIQAGAPALSVAGKSVEAKAGSVIGVAEGQPIEIDNRRGDRVFVGRLTKLHATRK